ncbi:LysR family transcriptional regulator [Bradyrhizobium erythrophlei]|jgi:DNA-binding transcriptional LysR family regulator|uniref:DNA-binding transcriptional regulator, LysR family n=1 Tax=Bradyrhizobium erythrophlei TaxID=1437360 RepID=A0A1M5SIU4_9BRAD|nr:DNA-binding transcriptional regulator, LysR family [Bradyrhizobium erythrophlei]
MNDETLDNLPAPSQHLRIDLGQIQHAIAAADHGSFRRAADALSIKQSTLSRSIRLLEHRFGVVIFERSSRGVRLSQAGRSFLRSARSIVHQLETLLSSTKESGRGEAGGLVVGFCTSLTAGNLRAALLEFRRRFPSVELRAIERSRSWLSAAVRNGIVDVHFTTGEMLPFDCRTAPLWSERILIVLPNEHPLSTRDVVYWTDLRDQTLLLSYLANMIRESSSKLFSMRSCTLRKTDSGSNGTTLAGASSKASSAWDWASALCWSPIQAQTFLALFIENYGMEQVRAASGFRRSGARTTRTPRSRTS